jgi:antitoxin PrlF
MGVQSRLTAKGQTTIPAEVRDYLNLRPGDQLDYVMQNGKVTIRARNLRTLDLLDRLGPPPNGPKTLEEIEDGIADAAAERGARGLT